MPTLRSPRLTGRRRAAAGGGRAMPCGGRPTGRRRRRRPGPAAVPGRRPSRPSRAATTRSASGRARAEKTHAVVLFRSFCDQSTNTLPARAARDIDAITSAGSSRSSVSATARANALVCANVTPAAFSGTSTCRPLPPLVLTRLRSFSWSSSARSRRAIGTQSAPRRRRAGVEVEHHGRRPVRLGRQGQRHVQLDRGQVGRPPQRFRRRPCGSSRSASPARSGTRTVRTQSGRWAAHRFSKNALPSTPSGNRLSVTARPASCGRISGATRA